MIINNPGGKPENRILALNLPADPPVMRRYNCTYRSKGFLYPPQELLRAATVIRTYSGSDVRFMDAVAERADIERVVQYISENEIDTVVTLIGLEDIERELSMIRRIKAAGRGTEIAGIGFYPNRFRREFGCLDSFLDGAFETRIRNALLKGGDFMQNLKNIETAPLVHEPDIIESVDRSFLKEELYGDIFVKGRSAWLFYAFGCSYRCAYCVKSYDSDKWLPRSPGKVFAELERLAARGYRNIRFLDDNITMYKGFLRKLLGFLKEKKINFNFYGFSRADLIDKETSDLLSLLNFRRIYIGIESFSAEKQKDYGKGLDVSGKLDAAFSLLAEKKIEAAVWIIYDPETEPLISVLGAALRLSRMGVSMALLNVLVPYRGTDLYCERFPAGGGFAIKLGSSYRAAAAAVLFYGCRALYPPNWAALAGYLINFPGVFLRAVTQDVTAAAGVLTAPRSRQLKKRPGI